MSKTSSKNVNADKIVYLKQAPKQKRTMRKFKYFNIFMALCLGYFGIMIVAQELKLLSINGDTKVLEATLSDLKHDEVELGAKLTATESEGHVEKLVKDNLGWIKEDEIKFVEQQ